MAVTSANGLKPFNEGLHGHGWHEGPHEFPCRPMPSNLNPGTEVYYRWSGVFA